MSLCVALGLTIVAESATAQTIPRRFRPNGLDLILVNALTNPIANLAYREGFGFMPIEVAVVAVETTAFRAMAGVSWRASAGLAIVLNIASASLSLLFV